MPDPIVFANPPVTIGPFTNVPAPGSPIRSDWSQQISQFVVDLRAEAFADVGVPAASHPGPGAYDVATVNLGAVGYPTRTTVWANFEWGFSGTLARASHQINRLSDGTVRTTQEQVCTAAKWVTTSLGWTWTTPAGSNIGFKLVSTILSTDAYLGVTATYHVHRTA